MSPPASSASESRNPRAIAVWAASVLLIVGVVIALVVFLVVRHDGSSTSPPPSTGPATSQPGNPTSGTSSPSQPPSPASPCGGGAQETSSDLPVSAPADVTWETTSYKVALPTSPTAGPLKVSDPVASCYQHSPEGALLAASQIMPRLFYSPTPGDRIAVAKQQLLPGPARDDLIQQVQQSADGVGQWLAFRYLSYSPTEATIILVQTVPGNAGGSAFTLTLAWSDGDWKLDWEQDVPVYQVPASDLASYAKWSGVS